MKRVLILSYGIHSTTLISKILIDLKVEYVIVLPGEVPNTFRVSHVIISGGPEIFPEKTFLPQWVLDTEVPVLGICYGMMLIVKTFGGVIQSLPTRVRGRIRITELDGEETIIKARYIDCQEQITSLPSMFTVTAVTSEDHIAAITDFSRWYGVLFHPESETLPDTRTFSDFLGKR